MSVARNAGGRFAFGAGAGSFYGVFPHYRGGGKGQGFLDHAHNDYLELASGVGYPVAALALAGLIALVALAAEKGVTSDGLWTTALPAISA